MTNVLQCPVVNIYIVPRTLEVVFEYDDGVGSRVGGLYDLAGEKFALGKFNWLSDKFRLVLINTENYTVNLLSDEFLSDIPKMSVVGMSEYVRGKSCRRGVLRMSDTSVELEVGTACQAVVLARGVTTPADSELIAYFGVGTGLPIISDERKVIVGCGGAGLLRV